MNKIKKYIIVTISLIIIIVGILLIYSSKPVQTKINEEIGDSGEETDYNNSIICEVEDINKYYSVQLITNSYMYSLLEQDADSLYNVLDPQYINQFNINKDNIISKLGKIDVSNIEEEMDNYKLNIDNMFVSEYGTIGTYFVEGKIINTSTSEKISISLIVEIEITNSTYYIMPYEGVGKENIKLGKEYNTHLTEIPNNGNNEFDYQDLDNDEYTTILNLMTNFTDKLVYDNLEDSYNLFSDEYKKARFNTLDEYNSYIKDNLEGILASSIKKYKINKYDDYTEYICLDQYGNYYIFDETAVMKYTVRLDTYTIDSDEFLNKYNNGSEQLKVGMNLEKVFQALNRKDYQYIYEKLYPEFRDNNFPTLNKFKAYMQNEFFEVNKITYGKFESKSNTDIYEVYITDAREDEEEADTKKVKKSFILKLEEGTDFVMSFNIQ